MPYMKLEAVLATDLLVGTHLEDSGMAYVHYGSKSGFDDVNVQKLTVGRMSSFSVLESANGYPSE